jgi:hypothetical protein
MTSELRSAASGINGAKSRGPITAAGLEESSRNALKHGFTSENMVVPACESSGEFEEVLNEYIATYQPATPAQRRLVNAMVTAHWRMRRLWSVETALYNSEMFRRYSEADPAAAATTEFLLALTFRNLADESRSLALCSRYESRLQRMRERAYQTFRELQRSSAEEKEEKEEKEEVRNEPIINP